MLDCLGRITPTTDISSCANQVSWKKRIDAQWARAFYRGNWAFSHFDDNPEALIALDMMRPGYKPPNRKEIGGTLLHNEYNKSVDRSKKLYAASIYLSIVTDGWRNIRHEHLTNIVITTPKPVLHKIVDDSLMTKTGEYLSVAVIEAIALFSAEKIAGVVTDNAANMKKMWSFIQLKHPHVICVPCAAHTLNLAFTDIFEIPAFKIQFEHVFFFVNVVGKCCDALLHFS